MRGQYVLFTTQSIFCMFFLLSILLLFGDSATYYWNNYAQWLGRNPDYNKNTGRKRHIALYGAHKGSICLSNVNIQKFVCFLSIVLMSHSSSYFLERNMLTSYVGPLTQTRTGVSSVTVSSMGSMRGLPYPQISKCVYIFCIQLQFIMTQPFISLK